MKLNIDEMKKKVTQIFEATVKICEDNGIPYYCQAGTVLGAVRHKGSIPWDHDADIIIPNHYIDAFINCASNQLPSEYHVDYFKINDQSLRQFPRIGLAGYDTDKLHLDVFRLIGLPNDYVEQLKMIEEAHFLTKSNSLMRLPIWKLIAKGKFSYALGKMGVGKYNRTYFINKFDNLCNRYPYEDSSYVMNPSGKYGKKNIFLKEVYGEGVLVEYEGFQVRIPSNVDFYLKQYYGDYMKFPPEDYIKREMEKTFDVQKRK